MNRFRTIAVYLLPFGAGAIGMIVFAQSLTFTRWNEFKSQAQNHDDQSWLLFLAGIALMILMPLLFNMLSRIKELENRMRTQ